MALSIRSNISHALERHDFASDFTRKYVPSLAQSPKSHQKMSAILKERDRVEASLEVLFSDINPDGTARDTNRDIDGKSVLLMNEVNGYNRDLHQAYVEFLETLKETRSMRMRSTTRKPSGSIESRRYHLGPLPTEWQMDSSSEEDDDPPPSMALPAVQARLSAAIRARIAIQSSPEIETPANDEKTHASSPRKDETAKQPDPLRRQSGRPRP
jgi:hypothetical protein